MTSEDSSAYHRRRCLENLLIELNFGSTTPGTHRNKQRSPGHHDCNSRTNSHPRHLYRNYNNMTSANNNTAPQNGGDASMSAFRVKVAYMKSWKPASSPSNRDRLELYALHKQAISGDAPATLATQTAAERAKYQSWKAKAGISADEAMRLYMQEADRQVRVYGGALATLPSSSSPSLAEDSANGGAAVPPPQQPRGLAAIPLLCAAASESRPAYLRRLANTRMEQAWWRRQEPLTATPGSLWAVPEAILLALASLLEFISLTADGRIPLPSGVVQSFFWPLHNCLLSVWMAYILVISAWTAAGQMLQTVLWGSRRTGWALENVWKDQVQWSAQSARALTEAHQPLTARLVGLFLWPLSLVVVGLAGWAPAGLGQAVAYTILLTVTWWYWFLVIPVAVAWLLGAAVVAGNCFALIELAGV